MKLLITIVQDQDVSPLLEALVEHDYRATKLASTGGFLRQGNTTLLIGVEDERLDSLFALIKQVCKQREQGDPLPTLPFGRAGLGTRLDRISVGGATVFSVDVERFEKI
ncbi:MAG: cyclic-di-AMP receptor [Bacillota bacterium]|jgi:uncharacterized protein YaaQ|nr:cyclic-di-AMP receptor [Bacillota bacterium]HHT90594.1 hypothetical protein [Bacillota bacterium]